MKKSKKQTTKVDNLSINASFDDVIGVSMGQQPKPKKAAKQNVTPKKSTKK